MTKITKQDIQRKMTELKKKTEDDWDSLFEGEKNYVFIKLTDMLEYLNS